MKPPVCYHCATAHWDHEPHRYRPPLYEERTKTPPELSAAEPSVEPSVPIPPIPPIPPTPKATISPALAAAAAKRKASRRRHGR
jgi:hypothetical protein